MKCGNCGTKNPKKFKFCKECGEELIPQAATATQTVIIKERRRGVPAFIWILLGMILVVFLCGLLVWLDVVDVPEVVRARLPDPIGDLVDAVDDARPPGAPDLPGGGAQPDDQDQDQGQPPQVVLPGNQGQQPGQQPGQPPGQQPGSSSDVCDEDLNDTFAGSTYQNVPYEGLAYIDLEFDEPLQSDRYDVEVEMPSGRTDEWTCDEGSWFGGYHLCQEQGPYYWERGIVTFIFRPEGESCVVGELDFEFECKSGETWYYGWGYNNGCCTDGCWCNHPSTGQPGCWQECAPQCAD
ncbi:MAG TPA: hypothetical protein G4O08_09675 [Anaerolineae bacterium]|nr:hypothetical protein [Anaerolineae bacterium]